MAALVPLSSLTISHESMKQVAQSAILIVGDAEPTTWLPTELDAIVAHERALQAELTALQAY